MFDSLKIFNLCIFLVIIVDNNSWNVFKNNKNVSEGFKFLILIFKGVGYGILSFD